MSVQESPIISHTTWSSAYRCAHLCEKPCIAWMLIMCETPCRPQSRLALILWMSGWLKDTCGCVAGALRLWHRGNCSLRDPHHRSLLLRSHERGLELKASLTPPLLQAVICQFRAADPSWYCMVHLCCAPYVVRLSPPVVARAAGVLLAVSFLGCSNSSLVACHKDVIFRVLL